MLEYKTGDIDFKKLILKIISTLIVNMIVIFLATRIFKNIYVENMFKC